MRTRLSHEVRAEYWACWPIVLAAKALAAGSFQRDTSYQQQTKEPGR